MTNTKTGKPELGSPALGIVQGPAKSHQEGDAVVSQNETDAPTPPQEKDSAPPC